MKNQDLQNTYYLKQDMACVHNALLKDWRLSQM